MEETNDIEKIISNCVMKESIKQLSDDFEKLSECIREKPEIPAFVEIVVQGKSIKTLGPVLYVRCPTLLPEEGNAAVITLPDDITSSVFEIVLKYIHCGLYKFPDGDTAKQVLSFASKHKLKDLVEGCGKYLGKHMSIEDAAGLMGLAVEFKSKKLKKKCIEFIAENIRLVIESNGWIHLSEKALMKILKCGDLQIDEMQLFCAVARWGVNQNRSVLEPLLTDAENPLSSLQQHFLSGKARGISLGNRGCHVGSDPSVPIGTCRGVEPMMIDGDSADFEIGHADVIPIKGMSVGIAVSKSYLQDHHLISSLSNQTNSNDDDTSPLAVLDIETSQCMWVTSNPKPDSLPIARPRAPARISIQLQSTTAEDEMVVVFSVYDSAGSAWNVHQYTTRPFKHKKTTEIFCWMSLGLGTSLRCRFPVDSWISRLFLANDGLTDDMLASTAAIMQGAMGRIRFPVMTLHQLSSLVQPTRMIPENFLREAFQYHAHIASGKRLTSLLKSSHPRNFGINGFTQLPLSPSVGGVSNASKPTAVAAATTIKYEEPRPIEIVEEENNEKKEKSSHNNFFRGGGKRLGGPLGLNGEDGRLSLFQNALDKLKEEAKSSQSENRAVMHFLASLPKNAQRVSLKCQSIQASDALVVAKQLGSGRIVEVDLSQNRLGARGVAGLSTLIIGNATLAGLSLRQNDLQDEGAVVIAAILSRSHGLQQLGLGGNNIGDQGAAALATALPHCRGLKKLGLSNNNIGDDGAIALAQALSSRMTSFHLTLHHNNIGQRGRSALATARRSGIITVEL